MPTPLSGQYTLVLGAGLSYGLVPGWDGFTKAVLGRIAARLGIDVDDFPGVSLTRSGGLATETQHPLANEALLEVAWQRLRTGRIADHGADKTGPPGWVQRSAESRRIFADALREALYEGAPGLTVGQAFSKNATLKVVADLLWSAPQGRIASVITFNIDDWLERALHHHAGADSWDTRFYSVPHATYGPIGVDKGAGPKVPVIHPHGLLVSDEAVAEGVFTAPDPVRSAGRRSAHDAPNSLVFTAEQYWGVTSRPGAFANHAMQSALQQSHCIFVGLSMRDVNLLRWLGLRGLEHESTWQARAALHFHESQESITMADSWRQRALSQHVWLTNTPDPLQAELLQYRGVKTVEIEYQEASIRGAFEGLGLKV